MQIISFSLSFTRGTYLYKTLGTDIQILQSWRVVWSMYCVTLRLHGIKKLTSVFLECTMEYYTLYFTFLGESSPSTFPLQLGQLFIFIFVIHFTKSKLIARSVPVLKLPEKMHYSSRNINLLLKNQVSAENIGIKVSALITPSTFSCYSATNSIKNLSNKQLFFTTFKRGYHPIVYLIPTLIPPPL